MGVLRPGERSGPRLVSGKAPGSLHQPRWAPALPPGRVLGAKPASSCTLTPAASRGLRGPVCFLSPGRASRVLLVPVLVLFVLCFLSRCRSRPLSLYCPLARLPSFRSPKLKPAPSHQCRATPPRGGAVGASPGPSPRFRRQERRRRRDRRAGGHAGQGPAGPERPRHPRVLCRSSVTSPGRSRPPLTPG